MLVYDMTKRPSFDHVARWLEELCGHADKNIVIMLVCNKSDLKTLRAVPMEDAKEFAQRESLFFMETSALEATNGKIGVFDADSNISCNSQLVYAALVERKSFLFSFFFKK